MKILAIIPARGGSKGVPGKNIKLLNGKPLLQYTFDIAKQSNYLTKIILSSDDHKIIEVAKKMGLEVPFVRPEFLATDETPTVDVVRHALEFYQQQGQYFNAVCVLQVTTPFRSLFLLEAAIEKFIEKDTDSLISVRKVPVELNPHWIFKENSQGYLVVATGEKELIARRQDLPDAYFRDGSIYLTKSEVVIKQHSLYGNNIAFIESTNEQYVNIDTKEDWEQVEKLIKSSL